MNFNVANVVFASLDAAPIFTVASAIVVSVHHGFLIGLLKHGFGHGTSVAGCANHIWGEISEFFTSPPADSHHDTFRMAFLSASLAWVVSAFPVIVQNVANIATLNDRATSIPNELLDLVEQQVIELLTRQGISRLKPLNILFGKSDTNIVAFWRREDNTGYPKVGCRLKRLFDAQILDVAERFSTHRIPTDFVPWPGFLFDE